MESYNKLKEIDVKNRTCYYFNDIMRVRGFSFNNTLLEEKSYENSYENILICDISYKTFMGVNASHIRYNKVDGFIKIYDGTRYLVLFGPERYDAIYDRIACLISEKCGITYYNHNFARIRIDSYNSLPIEKTLTSHNVINTH